MGILDRLRSGRRSDGHLRAALRGGGRVVAPCMLRRTSARGWGPWTEAEVVLGALPDGGASWAADDSVAVGFSATAGRIERPFEGVDDVVLRSVRFRTEAFWGMDGDIVVVTSDPTTIELALPRGDAEAVAARLSDLLL